MHIPAFKTVSFRFVQALFLASALAACDHGGSGGGQNPQECFADSGKTEVLNIMQSWYLWNDEADQFNKYRNLDPREFADADELLDYLRYRPDEFDRGFSYITTPEEEAAFFSEGQFVGFGFSMVRIGGEIRLSQVFDGSPAEAAGFQRGYRLLALNGRSIAEIEAAEGLNAALGPAKAGFKLTFAMEDTSGVELPPVKISKATVNIAPVPVLRYVQDSAGNEVGYVLFNTFISSASQALRSVFDDLGTTGGVSRVVIDLRYNGGGLVSVSEVLASLLAGPGHVGEVYSVMTFNNARTQYNETASFHSESTALTLDKIIFITSEGSASASELVINGLKPYFGGSAMALVGSPTYGKPVGQLGFDFCDHDFRLRAIAFKSVNADGEGEYFDGLPVDCAADDDLSHVLGDPEEASLAAALEYMGGTGCPLSAAPGFAISQAGRPRPVTGPGLARQYAGAY
ncbi:MAG TPA: S41 family peptidase [Gammaproteobacteria bacterium]|nr:S41 family peptidase [Gammaproteobacteria bacterium]